MPWPNDYILYSINMEDVRQVVDDEGFRELTDGEIKAVGGKMGDYIDWYDALLMAIQEVAPDAINTTDDENDEGSE